MWTSVNRKCGVIKSDPLLLSSIQFHLEEKGSVTDDAGEQTSTRRFAVLIALPFLVTLLGIFIVTFVDDIFPLAMPILIYIWRSYTLIFCRIH